MSDLFIPKDPINVPLRPLTKGMFRNSAPNGIAMGGFWRLENYIVTPAGLKRRPGLRYYSGGNALAAADVPQIDVAVLWKTNGEQAGVLLTNRFAYLISGYTAPEGIYWKYTTGTVSVSGTTVTGSGTAWNTAANVLQAGDYIILDANGSGDGPEEVRISSIGGATTLTLASTPAGTYGAGTDYEIRRAFSIEKETLLDWTVCDDKLAIVDHSRPPYSFDGTYLEPWAAYASLSYIPGCIVFFNDRLWIGNVIEDNFHYRQRIRWSSATNHTSFDAADYYDLPYSAGFLRRLIPLGSYLIAYFNDAIYLGQRSNLTDLPYQFDYRVLTQGVGLAGSRAIVDTSSGHVFVGQDDIYLLGMDGQLQSLECPVRDTMIQNCSNFDRIYIAQDPNNDRIVFGFPEVGEYIEKIWSYQYKTKAWSYDNLNATALANPMLELRLTWNDLSAYLSPNNTWAGMSTFGSWDAIKAPSSGRRLFLLNNTYSYLYSQLAANDIFGSITGIIETGDLDLDAPDDKKTTTRLTLKLSDFPAAALRFAVLGSIDLGNSWKSLGNLEIPADKTEGKVDFFLTGTTIRFQIIESTVVEPYTIIEMTIRVAGRGLEFQFD